MLFSFNSLQSESIVLKDINDLYDKGSDCVLREFKQLLSRHTKPIPPVKVYELVNEEETEENTKANTIRTGDNRNNRTPTINNKSLKKTAIIEPLPEKIEKTFKLLTEWLCTNRLDSFITMYADFKSSILERSILGLKNHLKSSTGPLTGTSSTIQGSPMFARKNYQPQPKDTSNNRLIPKGSKNY